MNTRPLATVLLIFALAGLGCNAVSLLRPTPTPTRTPTLTPSSTPIPTSTPTPTHTFTPTPTPLPGLISVAPTLSELPDGFSFIQLPTESQEGIVSYRLVHKQGFQIIVGVNMLLPTTEAQNSMDIFLLNPEVLFLFLGQGLGGSGFQNIQPIAGLDTYGEISAGYTSTVKVSDITFTADAWLMRKGSVGVLVLSLYPKGKRPIISIQQLAEILNRRVNVVIP